MKILVSALVASLVSTVVSQDCGSSHTVSVALRSDKADIVDTAVQAGVFKTLVTAVKSAELVDALKAKGPFTVFAPTDEAFAKLPKGTVESLLKPENRDQLVAILTWHVVPGWNAAEDVVKAKNLATLNGQRLPVSVNDDGVTVANARITKTDVLCTNGVIHIIDQVMIPSQDSIVAVAKKAGSFETLLAAATAAGLADTLSKDGPFTVLAPTDEAFAKLPEGTVDSLLKPENKHKLAAILKLHVISGRVYSDQALKAKSAPTLEGTAVTFSQTGHDVMVQGAKVITADVDAKNGVIHIIDTVILP